MNLSNLTTPNPNMMMDTLIFKGVFFSLSPVNITLGIVVVIHNIIIFANYYKDKTKLVAGLFMGIAMADILKAQGEIVMSVVSILVNMGLVGQEALYKSLLYYMVTALPGVNWSKLFNLAMTITLTVKVVQPFDRINTSRLKLVLALCCAVIALLHISDMVAILAFLESHVPLNFITKGFRYLIEGFDFPGLPTIITVLCMPDQSGISKCTKSDNKIEIQSKYNILLFIYATFYFICIPLTVLICMIIQIKYLKATLQQNATSSTMASTANHVIVTVFWVSVLFFLCNAAYVLMAVVWYILVTVTHFDDDNYVHSEQFWVNVGILFGLTEFTLPLMYALIYPIILISRKPELRERYVGYWRRITSCCGLRCLNNSNTEGTGEGSLAAVD